MTRTTRQVAFGLALCLLPLTTLAQPLAPPVPPPAVVAVTDQPADHETGAPGPPSIACVCTTNPVIIRWAPDTRRVAQPEAYHMYVGSYAGGSNLAVYNMGLATEWSGYVPPGGIYYIRIRAVNLFGGNFSAQEVVNTAPPAPVLTAVGGVRTLTVSWSGSPSAYLFYSTDPLYRSYNYIGVSGYVATYSNVPPGVYCLIVWTGQWSNFVAVTVF